MKSGVSEGALGGHYHAMFYKTCEDSYLAFDNITRGDDFSLTIPSVKLSDTGTYIAEVLIKYTPLNSALEKSYPVLTQEISLTVYSECLEIHTTQLNTLHKFLIVFYYRDSHC